MALIVAGERSGSGKTTITMALLAFLARQGRKVQSFKVGPDYIDPMFHTAITGRACRNLDPILTSEEYVKSCFLKHGQNVDTVIIEGVMGLFDGIKKVEEDIADYASTAHIARILNVSVVLVVDCSSLSGSIAAIVHGYRTFDPRVKIAGIILNRIGSDRHLELLKEALEPLNFPILGVLYRHTEITLPARHLGLVPTDELDNLKECCDRLSELARDCFNWPKILPLLSPETNNQQAVRPRVGERRKGTRTKKPTSGATPRRRKTQGNAHQETNQRCDPASAKDARERAPRNQQPTTNNKIAIARDRAFSFYYQDNLDLFATLGAELIPWSPLEDESLPEDIQGLYFGGGFPEMFARELAENKSALQAVSQAILQGMPTYAECGGLMYLCKKLIDLSGETWEMAGILPATTAMGKRLNLGYRKAIALRDSSLVKTGEIIWGHEFHRSFLTCEPEKPLFSLEGYLRPSKMEGWSRDRLHASYLHIHWGTQQQLLQRWLSLNWKTQSN
ncbi:MAG: cobyrinate a,c-diamide synthase [Cyanobacteria bacterium P01_E01_bin.42]